jgi:hypothetical protein
MNRALQPELHPGAESLSAFIEQALPQPERAQILEHIAACSRCRQVVFLSRQAAGDAPAAVPVSARQADSWYRNWHLAWVPAAAFALIAVVAFFLHVQRPSGQTDVARVAPAGQDVLSAPSQREPAAQTAASQPAPSAHLKAAKRVPAAASAHQPAGDFVADAASSRAIASDSIGSSSYAEPAPTAPAPGAFGQGFAADTVAAAPPREPAVAAWEGQRQHAAGAPLPAAKAARTTQARFTANSNQAESGGGFDAAARPGVSAESAHSGGFETSPPSSSAEVLAAPRAEAARLPSGLSAVSMATAHNRVVAIDPAGSLFVRESPAASWEPVARQWTGHLVQVRVRRAVNGKRSAAAAVASSSPSAAGAFEVVNDRNQVWMSLDGRTWQRQ